MEYLVTRFAEDKNIWAGIFRTMNHQHKSSFRIYWIDLACAAWRMGFGLLDIYFELIEYNSALEI